MPTVLAPQPRSNAQIAFRYRHTDSPLGVTRTTTQKLAAYLGVDETQAIHFALASFASTHLPQYEPDDGPLTAKQRADLRARAAPELAAMRTLDPQKPRSVSSTLFPV